MSRPVALIHPHLATLGEGPRWQVSEQALYFVDIAAQQLCRLDPATGALAVRTFDEPVGCFAFRKGGGFLLAMRQGFGLIDSFDGEVRPIGAPIDPGNGSRFNDGRADAVGRFFAGTVDPEKQAAAGLFRLDPDGTVTRLFGGVLTSNGAAFSADGRTFAWSDTPRHALFFFDHDPADGALSNRRLFHQWPEGYGRPDGGSFDAAGCYWTALFAGGRVARLSPEGEILEEAPIPCPKPTMISFGGPDLKTAYVTTAREDLSAAELARFPNSGGVFSFRVETPGLPEAAFAG
jgi:sugar lactone lactonase YvrE